MFTSKHGKDMMKNFLKNDKNDYIQYFSITKHI